MRQALQPSGVRPPFGNYSHGIVVPARARLVFCSGQLGIQADDTVPETVEDQAACCFGAIGAILGAAGMDFSHVVRLSAFVTRREHMQDYMRVRDRYFDGPPPASTLMIVGGFTRPEFLVEVEATAAEVA